MRASDGGRAACPDRDTNLNARAPASLRSHMSIRALALDAILRRVIPQTGSNVDDELSRRRGDGIPAPAELPAAIRKRWRTEHWDINRSPSSPCGTRSRRRGTSSSSPEAGTLVPSRLLTGTPPHGSPSSPVSTWWFRCTRSLHEGTRAAPTPSSGRCYRARSQRAARQPCGSRETPLEAVSRLVSYNSTPLAQPGRCCSIRGSTSKLLTPHPWRWSTGT